MHISLSVNLVSSQAVLLVYFLPVPPCCILIYPNREDTKVVGDPLLFSLLGKRALG